MRLINQTRKTIISENLIEAKGILSKMNGLLKYETPQALLLHTHFGIHTFSMKYTIDVIILNKKYQVVKIRKGLKPGSVFFWNLRYNQVLELPEGSISKSKTQVKDVLKYSL